MHDDTSLFPPRCCEEPLPIDLRRERVPKDDIKDFDLRVEELSASNPTHCSDLQCSKFIQERHIQGTVGTCVYCTMTTCTVCKAKEHEEELCPQDEGTIQLKKEAEQRKWRQCNTCRNMVELSRGCYHITCVCFILSVSTHADLLL
jgi:E3 ubiquitin-protein ligase RNF144